MCLIFFCACCCFQFENRKKSKQPINAFDYVRANRKKMKEILSRGKSVTEKWHHIEDEKKNPNKSPDKINLIHKISMHAEEDDDDEMPPCTLHHHSRTLYAPMRVFLNVSGNFHKHTSSHSLTCAATNAAVASKYYISFHQSAVASTYYISFHQSAVASKYYISFHQSAVALAWSIFMAFMIIGVVVIVVPLRACFFPYTAVDVGITIGMTCVFAADMGINFITTGDRWPRNSRHNNNIVVWLYQ